MKIEFKALGGGDEIGANCYLLTMGETNVILDCGLHPRKKGIEMFPDFESIKNLDVSEQKSDRTWYYSTAFIGVDNTGVQDGVEVYGTIEKYIAGKL